MDYFAVMNAGGGDEVIVGAGDPSFTFASSPSWLTAFDEVEVKSVSDHDISETLMNEEGESEAGSYSDHDGCPISSLLEDDDKFCVTHEEDGYKPVTLYEFTEAAKKEKNMVGSTSSLDDELIESQDEDRQSYLQESDTVMCEVRR